MTYHRIFDNTFNDAPGILRALHDIAEGRADTCTWVIADHPNDGDKVYDVVTIGRAVVNGCLCWRYGGSNGDPDGPGSHALCASGDDQSVPVAAVKLAEHLGIWAGRRGGWIFRQPMSFEREPFRFERKAAST